MMIRDIMLSVVFDWVFLVLIMKMSYCLSYDNTGEKNGS